MFKAPFISSSSDSKGENWGSLWREVTVNHCDFCVIYVPFIHDVSYTQSGKYSNVLYTHYRVASELCENYTEWIRQHCCSKDFKHNLVISLINQD